MQLIRCNELPQLPLLKTRAKAETQNPTNKVNNRPKEDYAGKPYLANTAVSLSGASEP